MSMARKGGMGGIPPIGYGDIDEWARAHRVELSPWEIETIRAVDVAAVAVMSKQQQANS